ncbi:MAG TPA: hypothetical protein VNI84_09395 [Pyrinomonadaceae bacterium]|nr:hypothetical protein [Pyrinomonadaceae bacterium]
MMKKRLLFILCLFSLASGAAVAQTKTVTNKDLEKFRQKRLQAERDYRENYAKLGFPSPEELKRQREQDRKELAELAERIRQENLEREKIQSEAEYRQARIEALQSNSGSQSDNRGAYRGGGYYSGGYVGLYPFYGYSGYGYSNRYFNNGYRRNVFGRRTGNFYDPPRRITRPGIRFNGGGIRVNIRTGSGRRR